MFINYLFYFINAATFCSVPVLLVHISIYTGIKYLSINKLIKTCRLAF